MSVSFDLVVKARIASSHSACELGVTQPLASQSAPLEKVVHANGALGGGDGGGGMAGGEGGGSGEGGGAGGEGGGAGHWQAHLKPWRPQFPAVAPVLYQMPQSRQVKQRG